MKNRILTVLLLAGLFTAFSGPVRGVEINDRLIIEAIGIDRDEAGWAVTVQTLDSASAGTGENALGGERLTETRTVTGLTVADALSRLAFLTGYSPLFSQAKLLILGRSAANGDLLSVLDVFVRQYNTRSDILVAAAKDSAGDILRADFGPNVIGAKVAQNAVLSGKDTGRTAAVPLYRFMALYRSETDCAYCPVLAAAKDREDPETTVMENGGTAFFGDGGIRFLLSPEETAVFLLLTGQYRRGEWRTETPDGSFFFKAVKAHTKTETVLSGDEPSFFINAVLTCDLSEFAPTDGRVLTDEAVKKAALQSAEELHSTAEKILKKAYEDEGCDIARFARRVLLRSPKLYKTFTNGTKKPPVQTHVTVEVTVRRTGGERNR